MERAEQQAQLAEFWDELVACEGDLPSVLQLIATRAAEIVGEGAVLTMIAGDRLDPVATYHPDPDVARAMRAVLARTQRIGEGIAGRVAVDRRPALINSFDPQLVNDLVAPANRGFVEHHPIRSLIIVPVTAGGELVGTLGVMRTDNPQPYDDDDVAVIEALAERSGRVIADATTERRSLDYDDLAAIYHYSPEGVLLSAPDGRILAANPAACQILRLTEAEILERGRREILFETDPNTTQAIEERTRTGRVRATLPMRRGNGETFRADITSAIFPTSTGDLRACVIFHETDQQPDHAEATVWPGASAESTAERDSLTGLLNAHSFHAAAAAILNRATRNREVIQLLYIDLDGLGQINDAKGRHAADQYLRRFAGALEHAAGETDLTARLTNDEFTLLLYDATPQDVVARIEHLAEEYAHATSQPSGTFTTGIVQRDPTSDEPIEQLLARAEHTMNDNKLRKRFRPGSTESENRPR